MNCEEIKAWISSYIDDELTKEDKIRFETHIKDCKDCYEEYRSLLEVAGKVNSMEEQPLPENFRAELKLKLEEQAKADKKKKRAGFPKPKFSKWTSVAAILLLGIVITAVLSGPYSPFGEYSMDLSDSAPAGGADEGFGVMTGDGAIEREKNAADNIQEEFEGASEESAPDSYESRASSPDQEENAPANMPNMQEKIIYSAHLTIQVNDLERVFQDITNYTQDAGGFIQNSYTYNPQYNIYNNNSQTLREGYFNLRIPSEKFDDALASIGEMGNIIENQRNGENITTQYRDIQGEVKNLEVQEERILAIMEKAEQVEDILNIERELNRVRTEINQRKDTLKNWDQLVDYSSIEVSIREEKFSETNVRGDPFKELGSKIQRGFIQSINFIVAGVAKVVVFTARAIPFILILILLFIIYRKWLKEKLFKRINK